MAAKGRSTHKQAFSPVVGDVIAPAPSGHVAHFASAFQSDVIEAEFEDIADETDDGDAAGYAEPEEPIRFDAASRRLRLFDRDMVLETAAEPPRRFGAFALATLLLCALSFWVFGGHAVFARLAGRGNGIATPLQITGVSTRLGVIDGMRVVFINGRVRNKSGRQRAVPVISLSVDAGTTPTMVRAAAAVLDAGASTDFQVRLPAPGSTIPKVAAAFVSVGSTPTSSLAGTALPNK